MPPPFNPTKLLRTLVVRTIEINRLSDIDIIGQRFKADFVVQLAFEGGAHDEDLARPGIGPNEPEQAWSQCEAALSTIRGHSGWVRSVAVGGDPQDKEGPCARLRAEIESAPCQRRGHAAHNCGALARAARPHRQPGAPRARRGRHRTTSGRSLVTRRRAPWARRYDVASTRWVRLCCFRTVSQNFVDRSVSKRRVRC